MNTRPDGTRNQPDGQFGAPAFKAGDAVPGLSSWILDRKLGGGGFGAVWLARHAIDRERKPVAFKFCTDPAARHRLVTHERNVVARVMQHAGKHPNIVPLLEYNLDGDVPWLMYEYVEGGTLRELMDEWQALPLAKRLGRAVKVLHQIAGALAAMHRLNPAIVHRDLKPANVLMAGAVPRITDFGIGSVALPEKDGDGAQTAGAAKLPTEMLRSGTKLYASPEQRFGAHPGPRDDVFALGVIAYQFVSGDRYSQPGTDAAAEMRDLKVPPELAALIVQSTAFNRERRPKDAGEWEATLGALLARSRPQPEVTAAGSPALLHEQVTGPGAARQLLVPVEVPPAENAFAHLVDDQTEAHRTESAAEPIRPARSPERGNGLLLAVFGCVCVAALAVAVLFAVRGSKPNETAKGATEQKPEVPAPKPRASAFPAKPKMGDECDVEIAPGTKMRFCYVPAGECQLGSPKAERDLEPLDTSAEAEEVRGKYSTKGFWLGKYEVTQAEWAAVLRGTGLETPSEFRIGGEQEGALGTIKDTSRFPVENVSWFFCQEFLKRANAHRVSVGDKGALDLPLEDEWEYACRGGQGNKQPFHFGNALNGTQANCDGREPVGTTTKGDFLMRPQPVGSYEARHPWGLCDMHGNVWEWCKKSRSDPTDSRVLCGGSWINFARHCRAAFRLRNAPVDRGSGSGFRVICTNP